MPIVYRYYTTRVEGRSIRGTVLSIQFWNTPATTVNLNEILAMKYCSHI